MGAVNLPPFFLLVRRVAEKGEGRERALFLKIIYLFCHRPILFHFFWCALTISFRALGGVSHSQLCGCALSKQSYAPLYLMFSLPSAFLI